MQPGNPGTVEYYTPFLTAVHEKSEGKIAILAHGHLGHSPMVLRGDKYKDDNTISLTAQVESAMEAAQALHDTYSQAQLVITGHSMGCWIALQVTHHTIPEYMQLTGHAYSTLDIEEPPEYRCFLVPVDPDNISHCPNSQRTVVRGKARATLSNSTDSSLISGCSGLHSVTSSRP